MSGRPAARLGDPTACPKTGHGTNPIAAGSADVLIDGVPAARMGDPTACGSVLASGLSDSVFINGQPAAVQGSAGNHGNSIVSGSPTVIIGMASSTSRSTGTGHPLQPIGTFDEQFQIIGSAKEPLANVPFYIEDQHGNTYQGVTDETGMTPRIATASAEDIHVTIGVEALEKWSLS